MRTTILRRSLAGLIAGLIVAGCAGLPAAPSPTASREVTFESVEGVVLAGQFDFPAAGSEPPLVFILHHSGQVDRDAYAYLSARLVPAGFATFRFDKRGAGRSGGQYGCCEAEDALAAYAAAMLKEGFDRERVFIVAQSIGTEFLARDFDAFASVHEPAGVVLLSSLLEFDEILSIRAPVHIIVSDSEWNLRAIGQGAVEAHQKAYPFGASFYVAKGTEHTLFDISEGPIDWEDPGWPEKFHEGAWLSLFSWLKDHR